MTFTYSIKSFGPKKWVEVYENGSQIYSGEPSTSASDEILVQESILGLKDTYPGVVNMKSSTSTQNISTTDTTKTAKNPISDSGTTFNTASTTELIKSRDDLQKKIVSLQKLNLPPVSKVPSDIWDKAIKPKLLTQRQIAKKMLMMQSSSLLEEDAQLCIYGKIYYKNGKLYDNDKLDPACVAQPDDEDYLPPIDENHPMWKKINQQIKDLENGLTQLGIKLGEFTIAIPTTIAVIATSLVSLVSSAVILPFGAGIPTAMTAVQTMMASVKNLQQKTAEILPLLVIIDTIGLLLPKEAQPVIAQINIIFGIFVTIIAGLTAILGLLGGITKALDKAKKKMESVSLTIKAKADPPMITKGKEVKLSVEASGSDYKFSYEWTDINGTIIPRTDLEGDDDGIRTIIPKIPFIIDPFKPGLPSTTYTCKVTDGKGIIKTDTVKINRI